MERLCASRSIMQEANMNIMKRDCKTQDHARLCTSRSIMQEANMNIMKHHCKTQDHAQDHTGPMSMNINTYKVSQQDPGTIRRRCFSRVKGTSSDSSSSSGISSSCASCASCWRSSSATSDVLTLGKIQTEAITSAATIDLGWTNEWEPKKWFKQRKLNIISNVLGNTGMLVDPQEWHVVPTTQWEARIP